MRFRNDKTINGIDLNKTLKVSSYLTSLSDGMYVLRYIAVMDGNQPTEEIKVPLTLARAPIDLEGAIEFISPDNGAGDTLHAVGDYRVLKVTGDVVLNISKFLPSRLQNKIRVKWNIEPLASVDKAPASVALTYAESNAPTNAEVSISTPRPAPMTITGHVENIGDVTANANEWIGNPLTKERVEALTLNWINRPAKLDIRAVCMVGKQMLQAAAGDLLGTVRQGKPINELAFVLEGDNADDYEIVGEAAFSDGQIIAIADRERLVSTLGSYLVGIRIAIVKKQAQSAEPSTNQLDEFLKSTKPSASKSSASKSITSEASKAERKQPSESQAPQTDNYSVWLDTKKTTVIRS